MRENMGMYRAKLKDTGEWVYWNIYGELCRLSGKRACLSIPNKSGESCYYYVHQIKQLIDPETVGECTGLTDKNDTKIFEGDIVEGVEFTAEDDGYGVVSFDDGSFEVNGNDVTGTFHENYWGIEFEVIGNIHDNSELLEVQGK